MTQDNLSQPVLNPKSSSKRMFMVITLTILVCVALTSIYMPRMILWYFDPPMPMGVSCSGSIRRAIQMLQEAQLGALVAGLIAGIFLGMKMRSKK